MFRSLPLVAVFCSDYFGWGDGAVGGCIRAQSFTGFPAVKPTCIWQDMRSALGSCDRRLKLKDGQIVSTGEDCPKTATSVLRFMYIQEIIGLGMLKVLVVNLHMGTVSFLTKLTLMLWNSEPPRTSRLSFHLFSSRNSILCLQCNCNHYKGIHEKIKEK